ncbi:MAG: NUDIX hydrolase [Qingshengfaniella sp.]
MIRLIWENMIRPLLGRPTHFQVAALCYRKTKDGPRILVLTSHDTRRWILPKGWPKRGFDAASVALQEAWEEGGVRAPGVRPVPIGRYRYDKRLAGGVPVRTDVDVYAIKVAALEDDYPEAGQRERRWMRPDEAADAVDEPDLKALLRNLPQEVVA